ncbi:hypothetical protein Leryth_013189 [Lithospermum erythrorhizon]|nr:hypothetical protein Leryth_013189 [Lithospermum erythrorhizon]
MFEIIKFYTLCPPYLSDAYYAFDQIKIPTLPIYNIMIRGLSHSNNPNKAIHLFDKMLEQGLHGNNLTFIYTSKACARVCHKKHGHRLHVSVVKLGYESYLYVCNALIHMYASWGDLYFAQRVFYGIHDKDLVSWSSLICGYFQNNKFKEVLSLFEAMRGENVRADATIMIKVLVASNYLGDQQVVDNMVFYIEDKGVDIDVYLGNTLIDLHGRRGLVEMARQVFDRMGEKNLVSWNTMIMSYGKAGELGMARKLFDEMPTRDVISWTSMISGYCQASMFSDAITLFHRMMETNVKPDEITVASVLSACAHLGSIDVGKAVHDYIRVHNLEIDIYVENTLIDMYCKCGAGMKALDVFHKMKSKDKVTWTSIISGLAVSGFADQSLDLFAQMLRLGVRPSHGTFIGILLACAHGGFVEKGLEFFESMERDYGLVPEQKHYGCVVDLLSRSGNLRRAYEFIQNMPVDPNIAVWRILLSACKTHKDFALAKIAAENLRKLDPYNGGDIVLSSNAYACAERWDDASNFRERINEVDVQRPFGWSSIVLDKTSS